MSFQFEIDPKEEVATRLIADVGDKLQAAFSEEKDRRRMTLRTLAERLEVDRSHVHRCLSGFNNMTLRTLAEVAWALDREVEVSIVAPGSERANFFPGFSRAHTESSGTGVALTTQRPATRNERANGKPKSV